jgi:hypothetical protein
MRLDRTELLIKNELNDKIRRYNTDEHHILDNGNFITKQDILDEKQLFGKFLDMLMKKDMKTWRSAIKNTLKTVQHIEEMLKEWDNLLESNDEI